MLELATVLTNYRLGEVRLVPACPMPLMLMFLLLNIAVGQDVSAAPEAVSAALGGVVPVEAREFGGLVLRLPALIRLEA